MPPPAHQGDFQLTTTTITIEGVSDPIIFSNLVISQQLADTNSFSFLWRQEQGDVNLTNHVAFYQRTLSKEVTINIQENYSFKGIVYAINSINQDNLGVEYEIEGKGMFIKMDTVPECNSFYKKTITDIFNAVNTTQGTQLQLSPNNTDPLFYTVQYNQTTFQFYKMMAARNGEWFYYNGTAMVMGNPTGDPESLIINTDVTNLQINAKITQGNASSVGFDHHTGTVITSQPSQPQTSALVGASTQAGAAAFGSGQTSTHLGRAANNDVLNQSNTLRQQASIANSVYISGHTSNSKLKLAGKIKLVDGQGASSGEYVIISINHSCIAGNNYQNSFVAVPSENTVPPYTNPLLYPECQSQPAIVKDNEDKDGLDRIKVHFPWQADTENSPWLQVLTPHAGKNKGMRFLPELNEEVLVNFIDNNAERPFVMGAVHTANNQSGNAYAGNDLKVLGSKSGRRLEIDDKAGQLRLYDNWTEKTPKNGINMKRTDSDTKMLIESQKDANNYSVIDLDNQDSLNLGVVSGGSVILEIKMEKDGKKITIHSTGSIEMNSDQSISLNSGTINIKASQELNLEGSAKAVNIKGLKITLDADTDLDMKGLNTTASGTAQLELKSSGIASMVASLIKIN